MLTMRMVRAIGDLLLDGEDLVFVTVLSKSGSAPSSAEAQMVVRSDGRSLGTVGGGKVEAEAQSLSAHVFETRVAEELSFDLTSNNAAGTDMICGGRVTLLLDFVEASPANVAVFRALRTGLEANKRCYLVASLGKVGEVGHRPVHYVLSEGDAITADFPFPSHWLDVPMERAHHSAFPVVETIEGERFVIERAFVPSTVFIIGAGHVGQQVARVAEIAGFRTVVLDDRAEYANREKFPDADVVAVLDSFDDCFEGFDIDSDGCIVIVTRGHLHDKTVLAQALRTGAGYIGMIGSRTKRDKIYKALQAEGFAQKALAQVHSPIGLDIGGGVPGEIAVSIVAELIQTRARAST